MTYYIGIDGGGTKTNCIICDENLNIIHRTYSGPSNFLVIGTEKVSETILNLVTDSCKAADISINKVKTVLLGTTGAGRQSDATKLEDAFSNYIEQINIKIPNFKVVSDARIALEGAFSGNPGSILIAGTGSIMFGKDVNGKIHRVGGFGRLIGDEGSGLTLGRKGLNIASKYFDGRGKTSSIVDRIKSEFNINNESELIVKVYSEELKIQDVAPLVIKEAENGDEACLNVIEEESNELLLHIAAMSKKLNDESMKIVFIGGTITSENAYSKMLRDKLNLYLPKIYIQQADYPPEMGAVIMAKQMSD